MKEVGVKIEIKIEDFKAGGNIFCDYSKGCVTFFRDSPADESEDRTESNPWICFFFLRGVCVFGENYSV